VQTPRRRRFEAGGLERGGPDCNLQGLHFPPPHQLLPRSGSIADCDRANACLKVVVEEVGLGGEHRQGMSIAHAVGGSCLTGHVSIPDRDPRRSPKAVWLLEQIEFAIGLGVLAGLG